MRDFSDDLFYPETDVETGCDACVTAGTIITTKHGHVAAEDLVPGMKVLTKDNGFAPVRAVRRLVFHDDLLSAHPELRPVVVPSGALGNDQKLCVSPGQKFLMADVHADLMFGSFEVLVAARHMIGHAKIDTDLETPSVNYVSVVLDSHQVMLCNGFWAETLYLEEHRQIVEPWTNGWTCGPGISADIIHHTRSARLVLKAHETALLSTGWGQLPKELLVYTEDMFHEAA
ncbi:MAG: Hint domain-containing protein [Pseudomonadota bacterium]